MTTDRMPTARKTADAAGAHGARVMLRLDELARYSSEPNALTRLYLTPEHKAAAHQVMAWMQQAGMTAVIDPVGNVVGRYEGESGHDRTLIVGSHIDTVRNAGKYDGNLGVVIAIEAVAALYARRQHLPFSIEVIAFGDEEGVRFPVTLTGSRAVAGTLDPAAFDAPDREGIAMREALRVFGCDPLDVAKIARNPKQALGYIEVHIEQGPVLQAEGLPLGIVTAISGASRFRIEVTGLSGHAGTVPMRLRKDAVAAAAEMVLAVERAALHADNIVATVGQIDASPGVANVIASNVRFTLDLRSPVDAFRHAAIAALRREFEVIAKRRLVQVSMASYYDEAAVSCDASLMRALGDAVTRLGIRALHLPSGAGHDGLAMAALCPVGMLFVRCADGVSHHPSEAINPQDADLATRVLIDCLCNLDPRPLLPIAHDRR